MEASRARVSSDNKAAGGLASYRGVGGVVVGPILNAGKLKALLLADGSSTRKCKVLDLSHGSIRKVALSLGEVAALDFEGLTELDLHGNFLVSLDGHSLAFPHLQKLRASNCRISSLANFGSHFRLRQLDLSGNQLTHIMGLADTPLRFTLQSLSVANNHIRDFKGLAPLSTFESLEVLDIRRNPISEFGLVAEGFALLCCHTLRQLNGRTVSDDVREAVETWAVDDACGRATAAAVNAFRNTLLHPEGPSLLSTAGRTFKMGRMKRPSRGDDGTGLACNLESSFGSSSARSPPKVEHSDSWAIRRTTHMPSRSSKESQAAITRASSSEVDTAGNEQARIPNMDDGSMAQEVQPAGAHQAFHDCKWTGGADQYCSCLDVQHSLKESLDGSVADVDEWLNVKLCMRSRASSRPVEQNVLVPSSIGHSKSSACEPCKLCVCPPIAHVRYYHGRQQQRYLAEQHTANKLSSRRRSCSMKDCMSCCTGTQTSAGWICPLDLANGSHSASYNSAKYGYGQLETEPSSGRLTPEGVCSVLAPDVTTAKDSSVAEAAQESIADETILGATEGEALECSDHPIRDNENHQDRNGEYNAPADVND